MSDARKKRQVKKRRKAGKPSDPKGDRKKKEPGKWPGSTPNLIAALNHKQRRQLLRVLHRCDDPVSPATLSKRLGVSLSRISYHVKVLRKFGVVALVNEQQVRGAIEHFYVSQVADHPSVRKMLDETEAEDEGKA
jgi:DNA-binding transcriptional ArsR family regulator